MNIERVFNDKGIETLKVDGYMLHSQYNPEKEAEMFFQKHYKPNFITVLFGYGLGFIANQFLKNMKFDEVLIVIDPLFKKGIELQKQHEKIDNVFFDEKAVEVFRQVLGSLTTDSQTNIQVVISPNYNNLFPEKIVELLGKVKEAQMANYINENTVFYFAEEWQENFFNNLSNLIEDASIKDLENMYNSPVIVASGGPSLTKQIITLKEYRKKFILIAAGSAINSLVNNGIIPDFVVSIDGGTNNYLHFKDSKFDDTILLYMLLNNKGIRSSFKKAYIFNSLLYPDVSMYLKENFALDVPNILGGSTVAHYAYSLAQYISTGEIAFIGQDLAYTNYQTHAEGNILGADTTEEYLKKRNAFIVKGYQNKEVWTDDVFIGMQRTFEEMMQFYPPDRPIFNCTEGGVSLKGFNELLFKDFCEKYLKEEVILMKLNDAGIKKKTLLLGIEKDSLKYKKLLRIYNKNLSIVQEEKNFFSPEKIKILDKNDRKISKLLKELPIGNLLTPLILTINKGFLEKIDETENEQITRTVEQSRLLYSELDKITKKALAWNQELIKKLNRQLENGEQID